MNSAEERREYHRQWRDQNRDRLRQKRREKYARNRLQERASQKAYYERTGPDRREAVRAYQLANPESVSAAKAAWVKGDRLKNRVKWLLAAAKRRAHTKGMEFSITADDVNIPAQCPVLGIPIVIETGSAQPGSPSIDRMDNSRGYVPGNVRIISTRANSLKRDMTLAEAMLLVTNWEAQ